MSAQLLMVRNDSAEERSRLIGSFMARLDKRVQKSDGFGGASAWQSCQDESEVMILIEFGLQEPGQEAAANFSKDKLAFDEVRLSRQPVDVSVIDIDSISGSRPSEVPLGSYLSISRRIASPGMGEELESDLDSVFGFLAISPGYLGHFSGPLSTLSDEVLGLVLWSDEASFRATLPKSQPYELKLYRKLR